MRSLLAPAVMLGLWIEHGGRRIVRTVLCGALLCISAPSTASAEDADTLSAARAAEQDPVDLAINSISCGAANRGALSYAAEMPKRGAGFEIPDPWWSRGYRYGTAELIDLLMRAAAKVASEYPGGVVGIADLSGKDGGALPRHRSHQSGRDADIIFYALTPDGEAFWPDQYMGYFNRRGRAYYAKSPSWQRRIPPRSFDMARNWAFVRALINDPRTAVQFILVSRQIRRWLLDYARALEEPAEVFSRAARILKPADDRSHNDHMHVRIACAHRDIALGRCRNTQARARRGKRKWYSRIRCPTAKARAALAVKAPLGPSSSITGHREPVSAVTSDERPTTGPADSEPTELSGTDSVDSEHAEPLITGSVDVHRAELPAGENLITGSAGSLFGHVQRLFRLSSQDR
ncbi:MAG: penicillin-insensitive murein endopeptidase [Proteobacteria bacterium]|nr:penicillin-insensitive murein endopeptidase [Pseudomonadota bacterium]